MCGILLVVSPVQQNATEIVREHAASCEPALRSRGPDHYGQKQIQVPCSSHCGSASTVSAAQADQAPNSSASGSPRLLLHFTASLLQLRGSTPSTSPLRDANGNILCFNGEIFGGLDMAASSNDGKCLLAGLGLCKTAEQLVSLLSGLRGPWSLIYWQQETKLLWIARDWLGKRSLLMKRCQRTSSSSSAVECCLTLSSVSPTPQQQQQQQHAAKGPATSSSSSSSSSCVQQGPWIEVPPGIYSISSNNLYTTLNSSSSSSSSSTKTCIEAAATSAAQDEDTSANCGVLTPADLCQLVQGLCHHPFADEQLLNLQQYNRAQHLIEPYAAAHTDISSYELQQQQRSCTPTAVSPALVEASQQLLQFLQAAVQVRCLTINSIQQQQPQQQCIEQCAGAHDLADKLRQDLQLNAAVDASPTQHLPAPQPQETAHGGRDTSSQQQQQQQQQGHQDLSPAPVLILFSGGVDSTLIAALAHLALPPDLPIDLSNVCFAQGNSPDRQAAHSALLELAAFAPDRQWRLIEVDSTLEEVDQHLSHIRSLLQPAATVMDLNIGAALWLAARAQGRVLVPVQTPTTAAVGRQGTGQQNAVSDGKSAVCNSTGSRKEHETELQWNLQYLELPASAAATDTCDNSSSSSSGLYRSAARVVLLGHGADEQCGGYGRHRTKFRFNGGWQALADELAIDVKRLWIRNLGRDDRLVADHGREGRHPFLDEQLMAAMLDMPLPVIADLKKPTGVGDKQVLRQALASLGIHTAAGREKRAIQFGSRIGKLSNKREFGSNRKANMLSAGQMRIDALQTGQDK